MEFQIWHGIADNDRNKCYEDCKNDVSKEDLKYEMIDSLNKAKECADRDVDNGGSHYRPFIEVVLEKNPDFKPQ